MNEMERGFYLLKRRQKNIKHIELAKHLRCTQPLISLFERGKANMSASKIERYKEYIDNH